MENSKGNYTVSVIIAVVLTALIVGGASYYIFNARVQQLEQQVQNLQASEQETPKSGSVNKEDCYKTYKESKISFEYPCDWGTDIKGKNTWSATGTVVAPDGKASFNYPAPDFGLEGMNLVKESTVKINGNDYSTRKFEGNGQTIVLVEMGTALNENGYNLMLAYEGSTHKEQLDHILATFKF